MRCKSLKNVENENVFKKVNEFEELLAINKQPWTNKREVYTTNDPDIHKF